MKEKSLHISGVLGGPGFVIFFPPKLCIVWGFVHPEPMITPASTQGQVIILLRGIYWENVFQKILCNALQRNI